MRIPTYPPRCLTAFLLLVFSLISVRGADTPPAITGIQFFQGTFNEARDKAKAENKYLFLDAYASWCGPCKTMDAEIYTNPKVAAYFREKFIALRVDMEKGEGPALAKRLPSINGYPSLLFFTPEGFSTKTVLGSRSAEDFLAEARLVAK